MISYFVTSLGVRRAALILAPHDRRSLSVATSPNTEPNGSRIFFVDHGYNVIDCGVVKLICGGFHAIAIDA